MAEKPLLFISHKHENKAIADVVRDFVEMNTAGAVDVYQSSSEEAVAPRAGFSLAQELKEALWRARVFILIYTHPGLDWSYCMFEYGVANSPTSPDTRIILLRCCDAVPALFAGQVTVNARELVDVQKFVNQLLTDPEFFRDHDKAVTQHPPNGQRVMEAAAKLWQDLQAVLPPINPVGQEEWPASPFLQLQLATAAVEKIKNAPPAERLHVAMDLLSKECTVSGFDKYTERLFNSPGFDKGMKLDALFKAWSEKESKRDAQSRWMDALCKQLTEAARWRFPPVVWELMQGIDDTAWYAPVVTRVRRIPNQYYQFDVYFFRFDVDAETSSVKVGVPADV